MIDKSAEYSSLSRVLYSLFRSLAPMLPTRSLRDWAWASKWRLWHSIYGGHELLWEMDQ